MVHAAIVYTSHFNVVMVEAMNSEEAVYLPPNLILQIMIACIASSYLASHLYCSLMRQKQ
ncbi:hypothetical protein K450DRAFT_223959 [Umbelopsis ramanniana AG]|uniref:Uncharacterized protein n=1 Tax=Umbelopsis ramanniana AG TaxID=1314678 RepID=A0AAD5EGQ1_UMBRA|nr:uncharacterized protein K450DRAFT_223959 [Umbelopsis ramanniana AG]KAI8583047.1 hypothetical protein K450DRAFT_223959 [Umbelopsis ramanniana AG]